jgi:hypothetical protein
MVLATLAGACVGLLCYLLGWRRFVTPGAPQTISAAASDEETNHTQPASGAGLEQGEGTPVARGGCASAEEEEGRGQQKKKTRRPRTRTVPSCQRLISSTSSSVASILSPAQVPRCCRHQRLEEDGTLVCAGMADPHMSALELADAALAAAAATRKHEQGSASATTCSSSASAASSSPPPSASASASGGAPDSPEGHADLQDAEILVNVAL